MIQMTFAGLLILMVASQVIYGSVNIADLPTRSGAPIGMKGSLQVTATGTGNLSYQWYLNNNPIPRAVHPSLSIPARNQTGTYRYRIRVSDADSEILSEEIVYTVFDVAVELGIPNFPVEIEPSVDDRYTYMLSEDGGIYLRWLPESILIGHPEFQQTSPTVRIPIQNSALVSVTVDRLIKGFGSATSNEDPFSENSGLFPEGEHTVTNYFIGEGTHWLELCPWDPFLGYRYGARATIKKVEIIPIPQNYFLADMYRMQLSNAGSVTPGDIEDLDFDGDGRSNLLEWMQMTNPLIADNGVPLEIWEVNGEPYLQFHWIRPLNTYPYSYVFEYSTDMINWKQVERAVWEATLRPGMDVQARDSVIFGTYSHRFLRIRVISLL